MVVRERLLSKAKVSVLSVSSFQRLGFCSPLGVREERTKMMDWRSGSLGVEGRPANTERVNSFFYLLGRTKLCSVYQLPTPPRLSDYLGHKHALSGLNLGLAVLRQQ